jgi:ligand-binding sensor domain-containing protein
MAQTTDGWLWLSTADGLYRFDGNRFERFALPAGGRLTRNRIGELHADERGNLWIGYMTGGLSVLRRDGRFEEVPGTEDGAHRPFGALAVDRDASI